MNYGLLSLLNCMSHLPLILAGEFCVWIIKVLSNGFSTELTYKRDKEKQAVTGPLSPTSFPGSLRLPSLGRGETWERGCP